jgi:hypothetical protein
VFRHVRDKFVLGRYGIAKIRAAARPNSRLRNSLIPLHQNLFVIQKLLLEKSSAQLKDLDTDNGAHFKTASAGNTLFRMRRP